MDQHSNDKALHRKHSRKGQKLLLGITAFALVASPFTLTSGAKDAAAATSSIPAGMASLAKFIKPIALSQNSYINLVDAAISPSDSGQTVALTLSIYNGGSSALDLSDYWFRLTNSSGGAYTIKTASADAKTTKIASKTKSFITLYAEVGETTKLSDLSLKVVKFDFTKANYEVSLGKFSFPKSFNNIVSAGAFKALYFNNTTLYSKISSASVGTSGDDTYATVNFVYNNIGKKAITLSGYKYYIVTATGETYEATPSNTSDLVMEPLKRTEVTLNATIPSSIKTAGWTLVVTKKDGGDSATYLPVGGYAIKFGSTSTSTSTTSFNYSTSEGTYSFNLSQLTRQPWDNQDILSARIRIKNTSQTSISIPTLTGYFYLDNKVKVNFTPVTTSIPLGLNAGAYIDLDVYAKMPTSYSFSKATLVINDQKDNNTYTKAGELTGTSAQTAMPIYAADQSYKITRDGSKMTATINNVNVYNSTTSKILEVQVGLQNNQTRSANLSKLVGYFVNDNGDTFPAKLNEGTGLINPSNKSLVTYTTTLPQDYFTGNMRLILGEAVTDAAYSTGTATPNAYLSAAKFNLPMDTRLMTVMSEIPFLNYKLTINKLTPNVLTPTLNLELDYTLEKDMTYNAVPSGSKLMINIEGFDEDDGKTYTYSSQELEIDKDTDTSLKPGSDQEITLSKPLNYDSIDGRLTYYVRIYSLVENSKKLIAEHKLNWFIENNWTEENAAASAASTATAQ
ncbi:hypothetical protein [Cohnella sp. AR92]|uniref:hypothetical protein n=1 Tax=Cohnella sp. AR92 TaxID=648716 RepID=UPI000F8E50D2|nr:hypothetical protein [Cohnella sp. AR92]RUS42624.1 hypothetical protein ELR57_26625 [Cohnella sp. AR92]